MNHPLYKSREFLYGQVKLASTISPDKLTWPVAKQPKAVFLTGATGFIGSFLLRELLNPPRVTIYCLVRAKNISDGFGRIKAKLDEHGLWEDDLSSHIQAITGDLCLPLFGLSAENFKKLAGKIDTIFHLGAAVNWVSTYEKEAKTNINGIHEILKLATTDTLKTVNYASSMGAFASLLWPVNMPIKEDDILQQPEFLYGGYCQTKWVGENLMLEARKRGIPINIFRIGDVKGDTKSGISDHSNFGNVMMKACISKGIAPDLDYTVNYLPVDYLVEAMAHLSQKHDGYGRNYQFSSPQLLKWQEVVKEMNRQGFVVKLISFEEWQLRINEKSNPYMALSPVFKKLNINQKTKGKSFFDIGAHLYRLKHDTAHTDEVLGQTGICCPRLLEDKVLANYFENLYPFALPAFS